MIASPAMADLYNVAATTYVQGAFNSLNTSKQDKLQNDAVSPANVSATVKTTVAAASGASDTSLVTEKAVASAIETATTGMVTTSGTQTLTNKTIDADDNTVQDLTTSNFKSGTVVDSTTGIAAYGSASDSKLVTEKAAAKAVTVTDSGTGVIQNVSNANGGIQVTKGDAQVQIKSSGTATGIAAMWIE